MENTEQGTKKNRAVIGVSRNGNGWHVWVATSYNFGTWSFPQQYLNKYYHTREEAVEQAKRLAKDPAYSNWYVSFGFRNQKLESPPVGIVGWQKRSKYEWSYRRNSMDVRAHG